MLTPISGESVDLLQYDRWVFEMFVGDDEGDGVSEAPTVLVEAPDGTSSSPTVESLDHTGYYRASVTAALAGRYVATAIAAGYGATAFVAYVQALATAADMPTAADVEDYLGEDSTTTEVIQDALDAEASAQRKACKVPAFYPADLRQALLRRVARNLALRGIPLAVLRGDAETGSLTLPGKDPEVRRLEGPYRALVQP